MSSLLLDKISSKERRELERLRRSRRFNRIHTFPFLAATVIIALLVIIPVVGNLIYKDAFVENNTKSWMEDYQEKQEECSQWLLENVGPTSMYVYDVVSSSIYASGSYFVPDPTSRSKLKIFSKVIVTLHYGAMRTTFLVIGWWRLWLVIVIISFVWSSRSVRVYLGPDMLGYMGNGRVYYSGIKADLKHTTKAGIPDYQVPGLACPRKVDISAAKSSPLGRLLHRYKVDNATNLELASIIEYHARFPAYVAADQEEELLRKFYAGEHLAENVSLILDNALSLHRFYADGLVTDEQVEMPTGFAPNTQESMTIDSTEYAEMLRATLHRVLTPTMRRALGNIEQFELATMILACEAGKSMQYGFEGGRWCRKSNFGQLCARAVLHSIPAFSNNYDFGQRADIRRALIYGSRKSVFGPVKFPVDFSLESRAARSWIELLMACPHELQSAADEVELLDIIYEANESWRAMLMDGLVTGSPEIVNDVLSYNKLFFMPLKQVMNVMRRVLDQSILDRLKVLHRRVSQKQQMRTMSTMLSGESQRTTLPIYERVFPVFTAEQAEKLSRDHGLTQQDIVDWSSARLIIDSYGWLGRRVGNYSVPESSIIHLSYSRADRGPEATEISSGMVPLRNTYLEEKWGSNWSNRFRAIQSVNMAEFRDDLEKILKGGDSIDESAEEQVLSSPQAVTQSS